jgi:hypothetical protein
MKSHPSLLAAVLAVYLVTLALPIEAQPAVDRGVLGNGAAKADDGVFQIIGTIGQATVGTMSGIDNKTRIGFWVSQAKTPESETEDLITEIEILNLPAGTENSLTSKLDNALTKLEQGNTNAAISQLNAFINQVNAQAGKKISQADADAPIPDTYSLDQSYPNPGNPEVVITFRLPEQADVRLEVYNAVGQRIRTLAEDNFHAGLYRFNWDGRDNQGHAVSSGMYVYRLESGEFVKTRKMALIR